jgi:hypothetical protein
MLIYEDMEEFDSILNALDSIYYVPFASFDALSSGRLNAQSVSSLLPNAARRQDSSSRSNDPSAILLSAPEP